MFTIKKMPSFFNSGSPKRDRFHPMVSKDFHSTSLVMKRESILENQENSHELIQRKSKSVNALYTYGTMQYLKTLSKKEFFKLYNNELTLEDKENVMKEVLKYVRMHFNPNLKVVAEVEAAYKADVYYALKAGLFLIEKGLICIEGETTEEKNQNIRHVFYAILRICDNRNKVRTSQYTEIDDSIDARLIGKGLSRDLHDPAAAQGIYDIINSAPDRIAKWEATGFEFNTYDLSREYYHQKPDAKDSASKGNAGVNKKYDVPWQYRLERRMEKLRKGHQYSHPLKDSPDHFSEVDQKLESVLSIWREKGAFSNIPFKSFAEVAVLEADKDAENQHSTQFSP